jgi:DNA-binding transcriptional regulator YdaS (Cro superfamily)
MHTSLPDTWDDGLKRAVGAVRNISEFSRRVGVSRGRIYTWTRVPAEIVHKVSEATGLAPHEIRPDIFRGYEPKRETTGAQ